MLVAHFVGTSLEMKHRITVDPLQPTLAATSHRFGQRRRCNRRQTKTQPDDEEQISMSHGEFLSRSAAPADDSKLYECPIIAARSVTQPLNRTGSRRQGTAMLSPPA